jgi:hypothetical protein
VSVGSFEYGKISFQIINVLNTVLINWDNHCLNPVSFSSGLNCFRWYLMHVIACVLLIDRDCVCANSG